MVSVRSEGFEDRRYGRMLAGRARAYIKVNRRDYSRKRRGFDIVVVNRITGNALFVSKTFLEKKKLIEIVVLVVMLPPQHKDQIWTGLALMDPKLPVGYLSQFQFLGNCPPTPPLSHHFAQSGK